MPLSFLDVFGNIVSILLIFFSPISGKVSNYIIDESARDDGYNRRERATFKIYSSYRGDFSTLFTSLVFGVANIFYLMWVDGLRWVYVISGFVVLVVIITMIILYALKDPYTVYEPIVGEVSDEHLLNKFPSVRYLRTSQIFIIISLIAYLIPILFVAKATGVI